MPRQYASELLDGSRAPIVSALPAVMAVYAFGSAASGQQTVDSDLDLAVLDRQPAEPARLYDLAWTPEVTLGVDVHLVELLTASTVLKKEVIPGGRYREGTEPLLRAAREKRARDEFAAAGQDAAVLNVLRACEPTIDPANALIHERQIGVPPSNPGQRPAAICGTGRPAGLRGLC